MVACKYPQVRNYETGRCKAPCRADQAVNPDTGRCVTKTFLKAAHIRGDLGTSEYRSALRDDGITRRDGRSRRSGGTRRLSYGTRDEFSDLGDFNFTEYDYKEPRGYGRLGYSGYSRGDNAKDLRDMLVDDPDCYPRKRNLRTGYCKTPCDPGYAINPRTGGCVTIEFLISRDLYDPIYIEDEEDPRAANLKWFPSDLQTRDNHDNADMKKLIDSSVLGVADLRTLRGIEQAANSSIPPAGLIAATSVQLFGNYSPSHRQSCEQSVLRSLIGSRQSNCGLRNVEKPDPTNPTRNILIDKLNSAGQDFTFITGYPFTPATLALIFLNARGRETKFAMVDRYGVWRILIRSSDVVPDIPEDDVFQNNDSKKLADLLDKKWKNSASVAYHPWDSQTSI